jgi:replicative DNA helicase
MSATSESDISHLRSEAEQNVISIGFLAPHMIDRMAAIVSPRDFLDPCLAKLWQLMIDLRESGEDHGSRRFLTEANKRGLVRQVGGASALADILERVPNHAHSEYYSREVARLAELRAIENATCELSAEIQNPMCDPQKALHGFHARTDGIGNSKDAGFVRIGDVIESVLHKAQLPIDTQERETAISTGYLSLDSLIFGLGSGKLYLIGGRSGMGKSALACNIAVNVAASGKQCWICSLEMESIELVERILSSAYQIDTRRWREQINSEEIAAIRSCRLTEMFQNRVWLTDKPGESFNSIRSKAKLRKSLEGLDVLIIDNLQLVRPFDTRIAKHQQLKQLTESFKSLAKEIGVAVVLLCQLSVDSEPGKNQRRPDNTSWADSKRIIDDADVAMILHRESRECTKAELLITKHRGGPEGTIVFDWNGPYQTFTECEPWTQVPYT